MTLKRIDGVMRRFVILFFCLTTAGCTATMLDYDFEGYQGGQSVGGTDPGPDSIGLITIVKGDEVLYTVSTLNALSGQKSLQLEKGTPQEGGCEPFDINCLENVILAFEPEPPPDPTGPVLISWIGRLENTGTDTAIQATISLPGLFFDSVLRVDISRDRLEVRKGPLLKGVYDYNFSNEHRIWIRISPGEGRVAVQVSGAGIPSPATSRPACDSDNVICSAFQTSASDQIPFVMSMAFTDSSSLGATYRIDDVTHKQPLF
jgi:hypothetical protein